MIKFSKTENSTVNNVIFKFKSFLHNLPSKITIKCRSANNITYLIAQHCSGPADRTFRTRVPVAAGVLAV